MHVLLIGSPLVDMQYLDKRIFGLCPQAWGSLSNTARCTHTRSNTQADLSY